MDIASLVNLYLKEPRRNIRGFKEFHPSETSMLCDRKLFYTKAISSYDHSPETLEVFEVGHFIHAFMEKFLEWAERQGFIEIQSIEKTRAFSFIGKEWFIDGTHDAIVKESDNGKMWIYDFKSIRSFNFRGANGLEPVPLPKLEHVTQINQYMYAYRIYNSKLIYIDKFSFGEKFKKQMMNVKEFVVPFDEQLVLRKLSQIDSVYAKLLSGSLPLRISENMDHVECKYCSFRKECKDDFNPLGGGK